MCAYLRQQMSATGAFCVWYGDMVMGLGGWWTVKVFKPSLRTETHQRIEAAQMEILDHFSCPYEK